jgi:hypothetical protein
MHKLIAQKTLYLINLLLPDPALKKIAKIPGVKSQYQKNEK